MHAKIAIGL
jgi:hypothetical protein